MIERIEDMPTGTIGFTASGKFTRDDYRKTLEPVLRKAAESGEIRMLFKLTNFEGLEPAGSRTPCQGNKEPLDFVGALRGSLALLFSSLKSEWDGHVILLNLQLRFQGRYKRPPMCIEVSKALGVGLRIAPTNLAQQRAINVKPLKMWREPLGVLLPAALD